MIFRDYRHKLIFLLFTKRLKLNPLICLNAEEEAEESIFKPKAHFTTTMGAKVMPKNTNLELINTSNPTKMQKTLESYTECRQAPSGTHVNP